MAHCTEKRGLFTEEEPEDCRSMVFEYNKMKEIPKIKRIAESRSRVAYFTLMMWQAGSPRPASLIFGSASLAKKQEASAGGFSPRSQELRIPPTDATPYNFLGITVVKKDALTINDCNWAVMSTQNQHSGSYAQHLTQSSNAPGSWKKSPSSKISLFQTDYFSNQSFSSLNHHPPSHLHLAHLQPQCSLLSFQLRNICSKRRSTSQPATGNQKAHSQQIST